MFDWTPAKALGFRFDKWAVKPGSEICNSYGRIVGDNRPML